MKHLKYVLSGATLAIAATVALAQQTTTDPMAGMDHSTMNMGDSGAMTPSAAYMDAMDVMMNDMATMTMTGDAEIDYLLMMIPHHQSAVDMSIALLPEVRDPDLKAFAEAIIAGQQSEITAMNEMLARLGYSPE